MEARCAAKVHVPAVHLERLACSSLACPQLLGAHGCLKPANPINHTYKLLKRTPSLASNAFMKQKFSKRHSYICCLSLCFEIKGCKLQGYVHNMAQNKSELPLAHAALCRMVIL
jgi:hypothetical protein